MLARFHLCWDTIAPRMQWEAERGFSGVVLVARDGAVAFHQAYGLANRDKKIPMRPDTIFAIGSTPIDFTKAGILLLAERRKLTLDAELGVHQHHAVAGGLEHALRALQ